MSKFSSKRDESHQPPRFQAPQVSPSLTHNQSYHDQWPRTPSPLSVLGFRHHMRSLTGLCRDTKGCRSHPTPTPWACLWTPVASVIGLTPYSDVSVTVAPVCLPILPSSQVVEPHIRPQVASPPSAPALCIRRSVAGSNILLRVDLPIHPVATPSLALVLDTLSLVSLVFPVSCRFVCRLLLISVVGELNYCVDGAAKQHS